jgi:glycosyltransferase involved in cell wall biosynthesis
VEEDRIDVVPRGRDAAALGECTSERRDATRTRLGIDADAFVLLNAARQDPQKGQTFLLDAFAQVREALPRAVLLIAGREGPETPRLRTQIEELGLDSSVMLLGVRADVPDLLCAADVFAFSSLWEGLGGALLEAMALGLPVVAFDAPAVVETLGGTGITVPLGDAEAMATAILELAGAPDRRAALSRASVERFERCYTNEASLVGMRELYERAIRERGTGYRDPLARFRGRRHGRCAS